MGGQVDCVVNDCVVYVVFGVYGVQYCFFYVDFNFYVNGGFCAFGVDLGYGGQDCYGTVYGLCFYVGFVKTSYEFVVYVFVDVVIVLNYYVCLDL